MEPPLSEESVEDPRATEWQTVTPQGQRAVHVVLDKQQQNTINENQSQPHPSDDPKEKEKPSKGSFLRQFAAKVGILSEINSGSRSRSSSSPAKPTTNLILTETTNEKQKARYPSPVSIRPSLSSHTLKSNVFRTHSESQMSETYKPLLSQSIPLPPETKTKKASKKNTLLKSTPLSGDTIKEEIVSTENINLDLDSIIPIFNDTQNYDSDTAPSPSSPNVEKEGKTANSPQVLETYSPVRNISLSPNISPQTSPLQRDLSISGSLSTLSPLPRRVIQQQSPSPPRTRTSPSSSSFHTTESFDIYDAIKSPPKQPQKQKQEAITPPELSKNNVGNICDNSNNDINPDNILDIPPLSLTNTPSPSLQNSTTENHIDFKDSDNQNSNNTNSNNNNNNNNTHSYNINSSPQPSSSLPPINSIHLQHNGISNTYNIRVRVFFVPYSPQNTITYTYTNKFSPNQKPVSSIKSSNVLSQNGNDSTWATYWTLLVSPTTIARDLMVSVSIRTNKDSSDFYICSCTEDGHERELKHSEVILNLGCKKFIVYEQPPDDPIYVDNKDVVPQKEKKRIFLPTSRLRSSPKRERISILLSPNTSPTRDSISPPNSRTQSPTNTKTPEKEFYCKFLLTNPTENSAQQQASPTTLERVKMVDTYFQHYYKEFFHYLVQRAKRRDAQAAVFQRVGLGVDQLARAWSQFNLKETKYLRTKRCRMNVMEFKILAQIGKGGFGEVFLAIKKDTNEVVTLKRIKKTSYSELANQMISVAQEEQVMMISQEFEWITKLLYSFQDSKNLYLAMEYHIGGDVRALLTNLGALPEDMARFYAAEMFEAVSSLHQLGFIHRDIKPSNFVIDKFGHLKLIDFGLSKEGVCERNSRYTRTWRALRKSVRIQEQLRLGAFLTTNERSDVSMPALALPSQKINRKVTQSKVGSPEYMAVEMIESQEYDLSYDFWSLGVVLLEMLLGDNPFSDETVNGVFMRILSWREILNWELFASQYELSEKAIDLLKHLLCESDSRYGIYQVKSHPFFESIDWSNLRAMPPPFVPNVEDDMDTSYFEDAVNYRSDSSSSSSSNSNPNSNSNSTPTSDSNISSNNNNNDNNNNNNNNNNNDSNSTTNTVENTESNGSGSDSNFTEKPPSSSPPNNNPSQIDSTVNFTPKNRSVRVNGKIPHPILNTSIERGEAVVPFGAFSFRRFPSFIAPSNEGVAILLKQFEFEFTDQDTNSQENVEQEQNVQ